MNVVQIVSAAGDGVLKDNSECSKEMRTFFAQVDRTRLAEYAAHCLASPFEKSGLVLQDIINELGRRLGFQVVNGLYQGTAKAVGNDGLWRLQGQRDLLVEVKTTDVYRIQLNKIAAYRDELLSGGALSKNNSMLLVVGRQDTGELEAQVRGSKHAWDMRLISVDALFRLADLMEQTENQETAEKIRGLLAPVEYTRLDGLVDVMFATAKDAVDSADAEIPVVLEKVTPLADTELMANDLIENMRARIIEAFSKLKQVKLIQKGRVLYWNDTHDLRVACAVSKRYSDQHMAYWYAYHPHWDEFIASPNSGYYLIGGLELNVAFALPYKLMKERLDELSTSKRPNGQQYWHVKLLEVSPGEFVLQMPKSGRHLPLKDFEVQLAA